MKHLFIINPAAGSRDRTAVYTEAIEEACGKRGLTYRIEISQKPGDCTRIARDVASYKRLPLLHGFRAYAASTVVNVIKGIAEHYVIEVNGEVIDGKKTMICVCNGRFYGGGFNPVPVADPAAGLLDVLVVEKVSRLQVPTVVGKYKAGRYKELPHLVRHFRTKKITIHCDKETPINLDGELRMGKTVKLSVAEEKIRFFYPKGLVWRLKEPATV